MKEIKNEELLLRKIAGAVHTNGEGYVVRYVEQTIGLPYRTYRLRMKNPGDFKLETLKKIFDEYGFTDREILAVFGR